MGNPKQQIKASLYKTSPADAISPYHVVYNELYHEFYQKHASDFAAIPTLEHWPFTGESNAAQRPSLMLDWGRRAAMCAGGLKQEWIDCG